MNTVPLQIASANPQPLESGALPFDAQKIVTLTQREYVEIKWQASYWKAQHARVIARELELKEKLKQKEAIIRDLNQRLYGKSSEKGGSVADVSSNNKNKKTIRPRGHQKGSATHGRTQRSTLPMAPEIIPLNETACRTCGLAYSLLSSYEESDVIEIEVAAHIRRIKRQKCVKHCTCLPGPKIMTAPVLPKLIPGSPYGNSVWEEILLNKFLHALPVNRTLNNFKSLGLTISPGTIAGGLKKIAPLFQPLYQAFHQQQMTENRFHNDETRWEVYEAVEGKTGHRWYLWLTRSKSVVYYRMDPTRSANVPIAHFADLTSKVVIVICDRYSAYKKLARLNLSIILAFCWSHVRRDFLNLARSHPELSEWGLNWANEISKLFHLNTQRIQEWDPQLPLTWQSPLFKEKHAMLGVALNEMKSRANALIEQDDEAKKKNGKARGMLLATQRKVLDSLGEHWKGLTVFYDYPEVKMDNNPAEQSMRNPVLGRNGYYGSGRLWSANLAAMLFSIFQTLLLWNLNPRTWLTSYFEACAKNKGQPPEDLSEFLPWKMNEAQRLQHAKPPSDDTS
jgi:transposase